tara:strand:+ start:744 stop:986 length:243 start_codon:yes stop_codon:yes gene_type:complete
MGENTGRCLELMTKILEDNRTLSTREIYDELLDLGFKNIPTYRQVAGLLCHHPAKYEKVEIQGRTWKEKRIRYWRIKNEK